MKRILFIFLLFPVWLSAQNAGQARQTQKNTVAKPVAQATVTSHILTSNLPGTLIPGRTYHIKIKIYKGGLLTFGELIFPNSEYLEIKNIKTDGGLLYRYPGSTNIVWTPLPTKPVLNVEYDLMLKPDNLPKMLLFGNIFTFFKDGKRGQDKNVKTYWQVGIAPNIKYIADNQ